MIAAGFQQAIVEVLVSKTLRAAQEFKIHDVILVGGVAANSCLRRQMSEEGNKRGVRTHLPSPKYCTDNAAMIAMAAVHHFEKGDFASFDLNPSGTLQLGET